MILPAVGALIIVLCVAAVVVVSREPGNSPDDTAVAYEHAWDRLDFDALWTLSGAELRDGRDRRSFVAAKAGAYAERAELGNLVERVTVDDVTTGRKASVVATRLHLRDGSTVTNVVHLRRRRARWEVVGYSIRPVEPSPARPSGS